MKILLLSAYDANSHKYWHQSLVANLPEHQWTVLTLEPRFFSWRIRGNSLSWAFNKREILSEKYDLLIATSMVDLNGLRGFIPSLASIPNVLYFHENQFSYPLSSAKEKQGHSDNLEAQIVSLYAALCANLILFNSHFNRDSFLTGVKNLLKRLPDQIPKGLNETLTEKSSVLPVPINNSAFLLDQEKPSPKLQIIWNHRWEYDKGPDRLLTALKKITPECPLTFHILGQSFRNIPSEFTAIKQLLIENQWLGEWGYIDSREKYIDVLKRSDAVLSTALHDFQGISILEAVATGCTPIVPNRLAYPELFSQETLYDSYFDHEKGNFSDPKKIDLEAITLSKKIESLAKQFLSGKAISQKQTIDPLSWARMKSKYSEAFEKTIHQE